MLLLWQTASSVAHAANTQAAAWGAEQVRDLLVAVIGAIVAGFIAWQNAQLKRQGDQIINQNLRHEQNAAARAAARGDLPTAGPTDERLS